MYNYKLINELIKDIKNLNGVSNKQTVISEIQKKFSLVKDRSVFYCDDFAIRFSQSKSKNMANTVLSLSKLQKYDDRPFIVCIVSSRENYLLLANTTFLKRISHSSMQLREDNIKGSFNGSDILTMFNGIKNSPENFEELFSIHKEYSFENNLKRLVESTNNIVGKNQRFLVNNDNIKMLENSVDRAVSFANSNDYLYLKNDLDNRVKKVQNEIAIAMLIDNVNIRGRVVEYLITNDGSSLKEQIINSLNNSQPLPNFTTKDGLGDYEKNFDLFCTQTDIKTKVMYLSGNPKAYNIDKLLEFLSVDKSVYLIYLLGMDENKKMVSRLCSIYDENLIDGTNIYNHWAGRATRGVTQFIGKKLENILKNQEKTQIDIRKAKEFLKKLIEI